MLKQATPHPCTKLCLRFINFGCCPYHIALGLYEGGTVIIRLISIPVSKLIKADSMFTGVTALYYVICVFRFDIRLIYASTIFVRIFVLATPPRSCGNEFLIRAGDY